MGGCTVFTLQLYTETLWLVLPPFVVCKNSLSAEYVSIVLDIPFFHKEVQGIALESTSSVVGF